MSQEYYDITIIGGGPVGMFAATYARMRLAKVQIIESLGQLGGQVATLFPAKKIYDIPAYPTISGTDLIANLQKQVNDFAPDIHLNETVLEIKQTSAGFELVTSKKKRYSKSIIIATGIGAFEPRRLKIDNAQTFEGQQLRYFVDDLNIFKDKVVAIAGGGDSAIDWALEIEPLAKELHLIHRRDKFRALEGNLAKLQATATHFQTPYNITALNTSQDKLNLTLTKARSEENKELSVDYLLVNYGFSSSNKQIENWGLTTANRAIAVNSSQVTNIPGIYAIGDGAYQKGKVALIATGFGEAPNAVNNALLHVYPEKRQPAHSTQLIKQFKKDQKR